jgi:hypothetical protein
MTAVPDSLHAFRLRHNILIGTLLLAALQPASNASTLDDLSKAASDAFGKAIAIKASEAAKNKANKKLAAKLNLQLRADSRRNQCHFQTSDTPDATCERKTKRLAAAVLRAQRAMQRAEAAHKFTVFCHALSADSNEPDKTLAKKRARFIASMLTTQGVVSEIETGWAEDMNRKAAASQKPRNTDYYEVQITF